MAHIQFFAAAGGGGEARGGRSLLDDVRGMCMSAGLFFQNVRGLYQQAFQVYQFALVCAVALEGHDSTSVADSCDNIGEALEMHTKSVEIRTQVYATPGRGHDTPLYWPPL